MGISERRQREREQRKTEIIQAAEHLFFASGYEDVTMDDIAREVELNKATIYLYFKNKETLFATIVLRGILLLKGKYLECMEKTGARNCQGCPDGPGLLPVFAGIPGLSSIDPLLRIRNVFSEENPYTADIGKGYGACRTILADAIREGIDDGTIRADLDPFLTSMYLMISFMGILSMEDKWKQVIEAEGFSYEQFSSEFFRFITPAISSSEKSHKMDTKDFEPFGFFLTKFASPQES